MSSRTDLQTILETALGSDYVYYQPPESIKLHYPAIVYNRDNTYVVHANDKKYNTRFRYKITLIDANPDSLVIGKLLDLPYCSYANHFVSDNLNHDIFELYY